jgi:hypothetical protein
MRVCYPPVRSPSYGRTRCMCCPGRARLAGDVPVGAERRCACPEGKLAVRWVVGSDGDGVREQRSGEVLSALLRLRVLLL